MTEEIHPAWSHSSNIYEVNIRQYTPEGTFVAFQKHLPRLKDMGVEILWFMPVTVISIHGRKGTLGSYYAVADYKKINPEFGSIQDFTNLVEDAHRLGFKIIIDWVANHSGNDNVWIAEYPGFYEYDDQGQIIHPNGWEDVSKLNYANNNMKVAMIDAMAYWIQQCNIDGFRCDMAHLVQLDFWEMAKASLHSVKPGLFWLAECEEPSYHKVFDATYTWKWMHACEEFCTRAISLPSLINTLNEYDQTFPPSAYRVYFTSNHDENSWNGTEYEKFGDAARLFAVFSCTWKGLPMIYSGQELPNYKRLKFFDKDVIDWDNCNLHTFYKTLLSLRLVNPVFSAANLLVTTTILETDQPDKIFLFKKNTSWHECLIILNFSGEQVIFQTTLSGNYEDIFNATSFKLDQNNAITMEAWSYLVLQKH